MRKMGQIFNVKGNTDERYLLCQVDNLKVSLINVSTGNRWGNAVPVENPSKVTQEEWSMISDGEFEKWESKL